MLPRLSDYKICSLAFLLSLQFAQAQVISETDSLLKLISLNNTDTTLSLLHVKLSNAYYKYNDYQKSYEAGVEALKKSKASGKDRLMALSYESMAKALEKIGNHSESEINYKNSLSLRLKIGDKKLIASTYNNLGSLHNLMGDPEHALQCQLNAIAIREELNDSINLSSSYNNVGLIHYDLNNDSIALGYFNKSIAISEKKENKKSLAISFHNIGMIKSRANEYNQGIAFLEKAISLNKEVNNKDYLGRNYELLSSIYLKMAENDSNAVNAKEKKEFLNHSLKNIKQAIEILKINGSKTAIATAFTTLGRIQILQVNYSEAEYNLLQALDILNKAPSLKYLKTTYLYLSLVNEKKAQLAGSQLMRDSMLLKSLNYFKQYHELSDSISDETRLKTISKLTTQYETEKKDNQIVLQKLSLKDKESALLLAQLKADKNQSEIELLNKTNDLQQIKLSSTQQELLTQQLSLKANEAQLQLQLKDKTIKEQQLKQEKNFRYGIIAISLATLVAGLLFFNRFKLRKQIEQQQKLIDQRKHISADLHDDVGSTLSSISIYSEAIKNKLMHNEPEKVMELVHKIGDNARETISNLSDIVWSINPANDKGEVLFNRMETFATSVLSSKDILLKFSCEPILHKQEFGIETKQNLFLIFKESINNIAKHADATKVKILFTNSNSSITMNISDNGKGFDTTNLNKNGTGGNGLKNVKERAAALKGTIAITSSANGTVTELKFPIN